jgi:hypothetical protein
MNSTARPNAAVCFSADWGKGAQTPPALPQTPIPAQTCRILSVGLVQNTGLVNRTSRNRMETGAHTQISELRDLLA